MDCHSAKSLMHALAVKSLSAEQTAELTEHITNCPRCAEDMSRYQEMERRIVLAIRAWRRISAPETLRDKVHRALETGDTSLVATVKKDLSVPHLAPKVAVVGRRREKVWKHRSISLRPRWARLRRWGAVAAAAAVLIVALLLVRGREEEVPPREVAVAQEEAPAPVGERVAVVQERAAPPRAESGVEVTEQPKLEEVAPEREPERVAEVPSESRQAPKVAEKPADAQPSIMETERPVIRLALIAGSIYHKRKGAEKWSKVTKAAEGMYLERGDSLDTRSGRARIELEGVGSVCCNRNTWLAFNESGCRLHKGEVCCDLAGKKVKTMRFEVASASGVVRHLGTRFSVKVTPAGTTVTVADGRVEVENEKGRAEVEGGFQLRVRKGRKPDRPRKVDAERLLAWAVWGAIAEVFSDDFNDSPLGRWPKGWARHRTEAAKRSGFLVLEDRARPREHFIGCPDPPARTTQHAFIPLGEWPERFAVSFRMRPSGRRNTRAGVQFEDGREHPSFEYDAAASVFRIDWPRGAVLKKVSLRLAPNVWHEWRISVEGRRYSVAVDGKRLMDIELADFGPVTRASLVSRGLDAAQYDDVEVKGPQLNRR